MTVASLALLTGRAQADDCLCLGSELLFEAVDQVETEDAYVDEGEAPEADDALAPPPVPHSVMWCLSSDDPRCSRDDDSGEAPYLQVLSTPPVILIAQPAIPRTGVTRIRFELAEDHGAAGIQVRLDRPPRG